ncbi:MAG TPA: hypothetical protein PKC97_06395 [Burkholderiaceae bacterium]|nr:hypothetical protein [Burkholderiaceae bacterium]
MGGNIAVFAFELAADEMARIAALDTRTSSFLSHRDPVVVNGMAERRLDI